MAYEIGTAENYKDLLGRLKDFVSNPFRAIDSAGTITDLVPIDSDVGSGEASQAWTVKRWDVDVDGTGEYELILMGPGSAGADEIYVGMQTYSDLGNDHFNWVLQGYTGYISDNAFNEQPGAMLAQSTTKSPPCLLLRNASIPYWFVANGRRIIVTARVSTVYESCYLGFLLPYGLPTEMPYPLAIGGSQAPTNDVYQRWSNIAASHRGFTDPGRFGADACPLRILTGGDWLEVYNYSTSEANYTLGEATTWPFIQNSIVWSTYTAGKLWRQLEQNIDGSYPVFPIVVSGDTPQINTYGELQGCYALPGFSLGAEDTLTIDGVTYVVMQNNFRTDTWTYWALKLE